MNQRKVILDYVERYGYVIAEDAYYIDAQTSGYTVDKSLAFFDRQNYNRMIDDIRRGKLDIILLKDDATIFENPNGDGLMITLK